MVHGQMDKSERTIHAPIHCYLTIHWLMSSVYNRYTFMHTATLSPIIVINCAPCSVIVHSLISRSQKLKMYELCMHTYVNVLSWDWCSETKVRIYVYRI